MFCDWLKKSCATFSTNQKKNQNQSHFTHTRFPTLGATDVSFLSSDWSIGLSASVVIG